MLQKGTPNDPKITSTLRKLAPNSCLRGFSEASWRCLEASAQRSECLEAPWNLRWTMLFLAPSHFSSRKGSQKGPHGGPGEALNSIFFQPRSCLGANMAPKTPRGSIFGPCLINFGSFWDHFGTILGSLWDHFGTTLGPL